MTQNNGHAVQGHSRSPIFVLLNYINLHPILQRFQLRIRPRTKVLA